MRELLQDPFKRPPAGDGLAADPVLDLAQIARIVRRGWWVLALLTVLGGLAATIMVLRIEPTFTARAQVLLSQPNRGDDTLGALFEELRLDEEAVAGEIAIMSSGRILSRVAERLELSGLPEFNPDLRPPEPEPLLERGIDLVIAPVKALLGLEPADPPAPATGPTDDPVTTAAMSEKRALGAYEDAVDVLQTNLGVRQVGSTYLVDIVYDSPSPQVAAAVPNTIADTYLDYQLQQKLGATQQVTSGLDGRLQTLREQVEASERALIDFRNQMLTEGFGAQERVEQQLGELSLRLSDAEAEYSQLAAELREIDRLIEDAGIAAAAGLFDSPLIENMRSEIAEQRQLQDLLQQRFGDNNNRRAREVSQEIERTEATIRDEVTRLRNDLANRVQVARARAETLRDRLRDEERRALEQSEMQVTMSQLERELEANRAVYESFLTTFTEASEMANLQQVDAQVVTYASPPTTPSAPQKKEAAVLGMAGGLFLGLGIIFLRALFNETIAGDWQLRSLLGGRNVVSLPRIRRGLWGPDPLKYVQRKPSSALSEAIRSLRSHLLLNHNRSGQVVTLVSPAPGAGKSTTCLLLARSAAQTGRSCVVVDTDLRRGTFARSLGVQVRPDLIDVLKRRVPLEDALRRDPQSNARILTTRTTVDDPAGILLSEQMKALVRTLQESFDLVILDTAPLLVVSDAIPLTKLSDDVVLVARHRETTATEVQETVELLARNSVSVSSGVLSMASLPTAPEYGNYLQN